MAKISLTERMKERRASAQRTSQDVGPFVTISRQYGCHGFSPALLLVEALTEQTRQRWDIYHKDILSRLATETHVAEEMLEQERRARPSAIVEFFRSFAHERIPSGYEIRNRITMIIRGLAIQGHAIILGQGGAAATQDLSGGLSVRLEAPEDWRLRQVASREGLDEREARRRIREVDDEREYLRKIYEVQFPRRPAFHITYDCSVFTPDQIAQNVVHMMKLRELIRL
jgi:cytidylate kinase